MVQKRSFGEGFAQGLLFDEPAPAGVGARQARGGSPRRGGEASENCGLSNFLVPDDRGEDPRFSELAEIGIPGAWLRAARRVGFDAFLELWRAISEDESTRHDGGRRMPKLREFDAYRRYQRNTLVRRMADQGTAPAEIRKRIQKATGELLHIQSIQEIAKGRISARRAIMLENDPGQLTQPDRPL